VKISLVSCDSLVRRTPGSHDSPVHREPVRLDYPVHRTIFSGSTFVTSWCIGPWGVLTLQNIGPRGVSTPQLIGHWGVILKVQWLWKFAFDQNDPRTSLVGPSGADQWKNWIQKFSWDCPLKGTQAWDLCLVFCKKVLVRWVNPQNTFVFMVFLTNISNGWVKIPGSRENST